MIRRRARRGPVLLAMLVVALLVGDWTAHSQSVDDLAREIAFGREELDALTRDLADSRRRLADLRDEERDATTRLREIETTLRHAEELVDAYERQVARVRDDVTHRRGERDAVAARVDDVRARLADHVERVYRRGKPGYVELLFGAENFGAALRRVRYVSTVLGAQRDLADELSRERATLADEVRRLETREAELRELLLQRGQERERLDDLRGQRARALEAVKGEQAAYETRIAEMEASAKELETLLQRLETARRDAEARAEADRADGTRSVFVPDATFESLRGRMSWPVEGDLLTRFGRSKHPRYGTSTYNSGVDIRADRGEGIRAIAEGQVEFVDWVAGYGKTVILSHGGGYYSLYAHASQVLVRVGDHVDRGAAIARVGDTDSLHGDCLHFELRRGGQAIDPIPWLAR